MNVCVYGSFSKNADEELIVLAKEFGRELVKHNHCLIYGGGKNGVLGAIAKTVKEEKGSVTGVILNDSDMDTYVYKECDNLIKTEDMARRKNKMASISDGFLVLPGGIGTMDEFFDILVLVSKGVYKKPIIIFNENGFFGLIIEFISMLKEKKMINNNVFDYLFVTTSMSQTFEILDKF